MNADGTVTSNQNIIGNNMYAFCGNNPIMNIDPNGYAWWHWALAATVVVGLAVATVVTCGGAVAAYGAVIMAANGVAMAGVSTSGVVLAFATVGAATALASSAMVAVAISTGTTNSEILDDIADYGESALYSTIGGGIFGAIGGKISHTQQRKGLDHSWSKEQKDYWKSQGHDSTPLGSDGKPMQLHHPFGRDGSKISLYYPMEATEHQQLHRIMGSGRGQGGFNQPYPFDNIWSFITDVFK